MLHAKFQDHRTSDSGKVVFKAFYHIWAWCPSWSCDLGHLYKLPNSEEHAWALIGKVVSEKIFEKGGRMDGRRLDGSTISSLKAHFVSLTARVS